MSNKNISIREMLILSRKLHKKHKDDWLPHKPRNARNEFLWLIGELGEVIAIIKKDGEKEIMKHKKTRKKMIEEITDCFMYLADVLECYRVTQEEFSKIYHSKMQYNLKRDYNKKKYSK